MKYVNNAQSTGNYNSLFAILGWISIGISLLIIPVVFGAVGIIFGYLHKKVNSKQGKIIMIAGGVSALLGFTLSLLP